jgi:chromosome segregation ATPase
MLEWVKAKSDGQFSSAESKRLETSLLQLIGDSEELRNSVELLSTEQRTSEGLKRRVGELEGELNEKDRELEGLRSELRESRQERDTLQQTLQIENADSVKIKLNNKRMRINLESAHAREQANKEEAEASRNAAEKRAEARKKEVEELNRLIED